MSTTTRANLRAFLDRDWSSARRSKDIAVANWVHVHGTTAAFRLAQMLLDQVWSKLLRDKRRGTDVSGLVRLTETFARANTHRR